MAPFHDLVLVVHNRNLGDVLMLTWTPVDRFSPSAGPTALPGRVRGRLSLLGRLDGFGGSHGGRLLGWRVLTTATITKSGPLVHARGLLGGRMTCRSLVLFENEAGGLADVVDLTALRRRTAPAVMNNGRVLDLRQAAAGSGDTGASLRNNLLRWLLSLEAVEVVLKLGHELRVVVLFLPEVTPALGEDIALLAEDGGHAVEGLGRKGARDRHWLGTCEADWLPLGALADVSGLER